MGGVNTLRVAALTSGRSVPSSRLRVRQHIPFLREMGVEVDERFPVINKYITLGARHRFVPSFLSPAVYRILHALSLTMRRPGVRTSQAAELTWLERELIPGRFSVEDRLGKPLVLDVDDSIWVHCDAQAEELHRLAGEADVVIAGNEFIADWFRPHSHRVEVIPTAVDTRKFRPAERDSFPGPLRVGWIGTSSNFGYLQAIESALAGFLDASDAVLVIIADRPPRFEFIPSRRWIFERWTEESEADAVRQFDIGLMPLSDDEWGRGKCGYKALQYMACGVPAIVSAVGFNRALVATGGALAAEDSGGWGAALTRLAADRDTRVALGRAGRSAVETTFSCDVVSKRIADVLRRAAAGVAVAGRHER